MSRDLWVNRCRDKIHSRFLLTQAVVLRWAQLLRGARPRIETDRPRQMDTPLKELATGAVQLDDETLQVELRGTPYEPPRPEPEEDILGELAGLTVATTTTIEPPTPPVTRAAPETAGKADTPDTATTPSTETTTTTTVDAKEKTPAPTGAGDAA